MGGADLADVLAGVDACVEQGIADPDRLGIGGWSYGGYMTAWAVTQTTRFRAAVAGASITNWISFHGVSTIPDFDAAFYAVDPFDWDGRYGQFSPMAHVRNTHTPTLFLHGEQDEICPVGQAHEMFRALKELDVPTELVVYPREPHGIREREHARDVLERAVGWFKRYLAV
jgi:dipeptidyl aminopeptidase/acylaminoacyl peptidase